MSSEHVEVLERLRGVLEHGKMGDKCLIAPDLVEKVIASLSAPQPSAEAQAVAPNAPVEAEAVERELHRVYMDHADNRLTTTLLRDMAEAVVALAQQPAAVDGLNDWRAAFITERAMRYREGGMAIEQARIHAETDAAHMESLAASQQPAAVDEASPYPDPRNRREAAALARLALAYLGVTRAHIDAVIARCETDLAAQQGDSDD